LGEAIFKAFPQGILARQQLYEFAGIKQYILDGTCGGEYYQPRIPKAQVNTDVHRFDILLGIRLSGAAEQGYTMLCGKSQVK
jgi:hypothetical protein